MSGNLIIKPLKGNFTRDNETFGIMDVYIICEIGNEKLTSKVLNNGGTTPNFTKIGAEWIIKVKEGQMLI